MSAGLATFHCALSNGLPASPSARWSSSFGLLRTSSFPDIAAPRSSRIRIVGQLHSSIAPAQLHSAWILGWRTARAVLIVPVVEELFWRAWLMRWLINTDFQKIPLGAYAPLAFWVTAILFASEHGPYWDVGLITGIIYNLWMVRSKSVADCILMHAVTNAILSGYVIASGQWQYWQ